MTVEEYMSLPLDEDILIKYSYKDKEGNEALSGYYVVNKTIEGPDYYGRYVLTEASGEQIYTWDIEDVESWVLCKKLDKFFEKDCISREQALEEADQLILETFYDNEKVEEMLKGLPPVTLINSKIEQDEEEDICR